MALESAFHLAYANDGCPCRHMDHEQNASTSTVRTAGERVSATDSCEALVVSRLSGEQ